MAVGGKDEIEDIISHGEGEIVKKLDDDEKEIYNFNQYVRCGKCVSTKTFSLGTKYDRTIKVWRCRTCGHTWKESGIKI